MDLPKMCLALFKAADAVARFVRPKKSEIVLNEVFQGPML
jgi:hypothetical protein